MADPPFFEHLIFENPLPLVIVLSVAAVAVLLVNRGRLSRRTVVGVGMLVALAGLSFAVSRWVQTDREQLMAAARRLVEHALADDLTAMGAMFDPIAVLKGPGGRVWVPAVMVFTTMQRVDQKYVLGTHKLRDLDAEIRCESHGLTLLKVTSVVGADASRPHRTVWELAWRRNEEGRWRIKEARWLKLDGLDPAIDLLP